jgi:hypothetical protein
MFNRPHNVSRPTHCVFPSLGLTLWPPLAGFYFYSPDFSSLIALYSVIGPIAVHVLEKSKGPFYRNGPPVAPREPEPVANAHWAHALHACPFPPLRAGTLK